DRNDRRGVAVSLTARGRRAIDDAIQLRLDAADGRLRSISGRERKQLATLLRKVRLAGMHEH
ncbi:MAG: MarR family transcriptional regulator, partial [Woeseiaceae bacterium]|nr:MarR family transcriptional regulator [Woeseiaceae bacterium]